MRSKLASGTQTSRSATLNSTWRARSDAARRARSMATLLKSTAVTFQPCSASHRASAPSPQAISSADPGCIPATISGSCECGLPDQSRSEVPYRSFQNPASITECCRSGQIRPPQPAWGLAGGSDPDAESQPAERRRFRYPSQSAVRRSRAPAAATTGSTVSSKGLPPSKTSMSTASRYVSPPRSSS